MKLFQQLLVAPAALGLMAPLAASAADLNIDAVSDYSAGSEQITSISDFSDVQPTDWAYQALSSLAQRYGCVSGQPNGNKAMTRFEAAALLNACLENVTEVTDDVRRLMNEFGPEMAVLKGRVDGLEAKVGDFAAGQFSTTTKMSGVATFVLGSNIYDGDAADSGAESKATLARQADGATTFNYDYKIDLDTSFTGDDLLKTRLRAGNFNDSAWSGSASVALAALEVANGTTKDTLQVDRIWYSFPVGDDFTITAGPKVRQDDMLAVWPSNYPGDSILDFFTYAGAPGAYNLTNGGGVGATWGTGDFDLSVNYVSNNADNAQAHSGGGGVMGEEAGNSTTVQLAYTQENWGGALAWNYAASDDNGTGLPAGGSTPLANAVQDMGVTSSWGLSAWWSPDQTGWIPSVSTGWGVNRSEDEDDSNATYDSATSQSWYIGLHWEDAFIDGNTFGMAFGQPTFVTDIDYDSSSTGDDADSDPNYAFEFWYQIQVSDNITVTPALYYLTNPLGDDRSNIEGTTYSANSDTDKGDMDFRNVGALIKTTFKF